MKTKKKHKILIAVVTALLLVSALTLTVSAEGTAVSEGAVNDNLFEEIYNELYAHASEIISALTLVGTLIIGFAYKKGLLPLVSRAVNGIQSAVGKIKENTEQGAKSTQDGIEAINTKLSELENSLNIFSESFCELGERLECCCDYENDKKKMSTLISAQVDMLYDIFMTSSLPQYQKDAVGARIGKMREELSAYEKSEE